MLVNKFTLQISSSFQPKYTEFNNNGNLLNTQARSIFTLFIIGLSLSRIVKRKEPNKKKEEILGCITGYRNVILIPHYDQKI